MDESLFIGSSLNILKGDFLLRDYALDKPFLMAWWPIIGIVLAGANPIGFRLSGIIFSAIGFYFLMLFFEKELAKKSNFKTSNLVFS
jgi:hypothetical protein